MKLLLYIVASLYFTIPSVNAQVTRPPIYDTCNYLRPLEGEWMNINGNDTIRVYLRFHRNLSVDPETYNYISDELWGWIEYKKGSAVIMSDYGNRFSALPYSLNSLTPGFMSINIWAGKGGHQPEPVSYIPCQNPITDITGRLVDSALCGNAVTIIATVNGTNSGAQMTWLLRTSSSIVVPGCDGFSLPDSFTLTKQ